MIVALAGLHPAVWWIDRQINLERETACDDWAVNATGSARGLAICLTKLAAMPGRPADAVLLPAALLSSELSTRVVRLLDRSRNTSTTPTAGAAMLVAPVLGALALAVASVKLVATSPRLPTIHARGFGPAGGCDGRRLRPSSAPPRPVPDPLSALGTGRRLRLSAPDDWRLHSRERSRRPPRLRPRATSRNPHLRRLRRRRDWRLRCRRRPSCGEHNWARSVRGSPCRPSTTSHQRHRPNQDAGGRTRPARAPTPWGAAADAGVTVGKGTQKAAIATAGFFTKLSKSISGVF